MATTIMEANTDSFGVLLGKDFSELRNGKILSTRFASIVVASISGGSMDEN